MTPAPGEAYPAYVITPTADILGSPAPAPRRWGRIAVVGAAGVAVLAVAGGGFAAYGALSGGGTQPETFVPSTAVAYVELDLNPPASQKLNTVRLLHKLPKGTVKATGEDYRDLLLSAAFSHGDVNYKRDVDPWLGDRAAVAVLPPVAGGDEPTVEAVLQVKDEKMFAKVAPRLFKGEDPGGYVLVDGYVVISDDADLAKRVVADAAKSDLAHDPDYTLDTQDLGDRVVTGWYDLKRAVTLVPSAAATSSLTQAIGQMRATFAVQVQPDGLELVANSTGGKDLGSSQPGQLLATLPASTIGAVEVTGAGGRVMQQWDQVLKGMNASGVGVNPDQLIDVYQKQLGLKLPGDLATLLGTDAVAAVTLAKGAHQPGFGYYALTDPAKAASLTKRLTPLLTRFGVPPAKATADGLAWGTSPTWAKDATSGHLGSSPRVQAALPELAKADLAVYVDLNAVTHLHVVPGALGGGSTASVEEIGLDTLGMTSWHDGSTSHIRIKLTVK